MLREPGMWKRPVSYADTDANSNPDSVTHSDANPDSVTLAAKPGPWTTRADVRILLLHRRLPGCSIECP